MIEIRDFQSGGKLHGADIFVSYARADQEMARRFAEGFTHERFHVWWDAALHSGDVFDEAIEKELRAARAVVVLWSPRSVASRWVRAEATLADRNKTLAPVIIEACDRPIIFELTHTVDFCHWQGDTSDPVWRNFVADLRRQISSKALASQQAPPPPPPISTQPPAHAPQAHQAAGITAGSAADALASGNVENLLSALSTLQQAIQQNNAPAQNAPPAAIQAPPAYTAPPQAPAPPPAPISPAPPSIAEDESDETQFFTSSDEFSLIEGDDFHCLELMMGEDMEKRFIISPLGLKIGRTAPSDVVLADGKVSRKHCMVELKDGRVFVSDLQSTNGTFVDGQRVEGAAVLPEDSLLRIGPFALVHKVRHRTEV